MSCQDLICKIFADKEIKEINYKEVMQIIETALSDLPEKHRTVIRLHYGLDGSKGLTLQQIGGILGVTRERVRQLEKKALRCLKHPSKTRQFQQYFA